MPGNTRKKRRKGRGTQGGRPSTRTPGRPRNRAEARQRAQARRASSKRGGSRGGATATRTADGRRVPQPASWKGAFMKGALASVLFFALFAGLFSRPVSNSAALAGFTLVFYVPLSYYLDSFMYRRFQNNLARARAQADAESEQNGSG
jgi:hypothetical protein